MPKRFKTSYQSFLQVSKQTTAVMDKVKLVEENANLISETNYLRKDLKLEMRKNMKMEALLGLTKKVLTNRESEKRLNDAVATRQEIHSEYKQKITVSTFESSLLYCFA